MRVRGETATEEDGDKGGVIEKVDERPERDEDELDEVTKWNGND